MIAAASLLLLGALAPAPCAQDVEAKPDASRVERLERWRSMDASERERMAERFEAFRGLPEEERERLMARAGRLQREIERTLLSLTPEERAKIEALAPDERRRVLRGLLADRARTSADRLRANLDDEQRRALESAGPKEREKLMRRIKGEQRSRFVKHLGRELGLSERELRRVEAGTPEERRAALVAAARRRATRYVEKHGLPPEVSAETWANIAASDDAEFVRGYLRIRGRHPEFGVPPSTWNRRARRRGAMASRLEAYSRPSMEERAQNPRAREKELRRDTILERRDRVEDFLIRRVGLGERGATWLRGLDDEAFVRVVIGATSALRRGEDVAGDLARRAEGREGPRRRKR